MKYQADYRVEDLLQNESFLNFYFGKNEADVFEWQEWSEDNAERLALLSETFLVLDKLSLKWTENEIKENFLQLETDIQEEKNGVRNGTNLPSIRPLVHYRWFSAIAASVALVLGVSAVWWWYGVSQKDAATYENLITKSSVRLLEKTNGNAKPLLVVLSDGSSVLLQKNSRLSYPPTFQGETREVYLEGEALFEVAKNSEKPFFVYANELVAKVLGTSFVVKAYPDQKNVQILVKTGKVSVYRFAEAKAKEITQSRELDGVVITPNQQITYQRIEAEFKKSIVEQPVALNNELFEFKNTPVSDVLKTIQETYGIVIVYDENTLANCPLTASLTDEPLYGKLDLICRAIGADYQVIDGQIVVNSKGCK